MWYNIVVHQWEQFHTDNDLVYQLLVRHLARIQHFHHVRMQKEDLTIVVKTIWLAR